jgi:hypothetical protein
MPRPAFLSKKSLAFELDVDEPMVDRLVLEGVLPTAVRRSGKYLWYWPSILAALDALSKVVHGQIYFVGFRDYVKIGFTRGPLKYRLADLQTAVPEKLAVLAVIEGSVADERALHKRFFAYRLEGEWFRFESELKTFVEALE